MEPDEYSLGPSAGVVPMDAVASSNGAAANFAPSTAEICEIFSRAESSEPPVIEGEKGCCFGQSSAKSRVDGFRRCPRCAGLTPEAGLREVGLRSVGGLNAGGGGIGEFLAIFVCGLKAGGGGGTTLPLSV